MVSTASMSILKVFESSIYKPFINFFQACASGNFEITNMLTYAAEQVLGRKGVLEVMVECL